MREVWPGDPYPLGATWDGTGTNFALFSEVARRVELCLFDADGTETRRDLPEVDGFVWHGYLPGVGPGQRYGYRVHGPFSPRDGDRCNPAKLLLDPYGKAVEGGVRWHESLFSYRFDDPDALNEDDSAPYMPKNVVVNPFFDWGDDRPPRVPYHESVIYEAHVKGLTKLHPGIPEEQRGTYAGLGHPVMIDHLVDLGMTAVELMPVHQSIPEHALVARGLDNYWGYNTIGFFAPHNSYSASGQAGEQVLEFKAMVRALMDEQEKGGVSSVMFGRREADWLPAMALGEKGRKRGGKNGAGGELRTDSSGLPVIGHGRKNPNQARRKV